MLGAAPQSELVDMTTDVKGDISLAWLEELRQWCLIDRQGNLIDNHDKHYTLFIALLKPNGGTVTAYPGWNGDEEGNEEELKQELYKWVDRVLEKRRAPTDE